MSFWTLVLFFPACFALNMAPGPNNLLAMNNARLYGFNVTILSGVGRIIAFAMMIALSASGLAAVLYASELLFLTIKFAGACYLFWLALKLWRYNVNPVADLNEKLTLVALARQEFLLAVGNPKAILIFTAFLPQFVDINANINAQFFALGLSFLILELVAIVIYTLLGIYLRRWFTQPKMVKRFNRTCAAFLTFSGANLIFSRQS